MTPPLPDHMRKHRPRAQVRALEVHLDDAVPDLLFGVQHRAERTDCRVVHQRVDLAMDPQRMVHHALHVFGAGNVGFEQLDIEALRFLFQFRDGVLGEA